MVDATVIGAGVAGLCVATEIAARGGSVAVFDRAPGPGPDACSWWAGGMLAPDCEGERAEEPVVRLGAEAADWWARHAGGVSRNGSLVVAPGRDLADLRRFAGRTRGHRALDAAAIAALEPDLAGRFHNGLHFAGEAHLAPRAALEALRGILAARGVELRYGVAPGEAPLAGQVIRCCGLGARDALPDLRGVKGEMLVLRLRDIALSRPVRLLHPRIPLYVVPRGDGVFMLGATMIESDERTRVTARSLLELLGGAYALHPGFAEAEVLEIGVDARPAFPDNLPRIRRVGREIHVNGLYRHGFLLSPALARMTADLVLDATHTTEMLDEHPPQR